MEKTMEQTERIRHMEQCLTHASKAVMNLSVALDQYVEAKHALQQLSDYYGSEVWKQDFADDETGRLHEDLSRGVLSEDGIWNVLEDNKDVLRRIKHINKKTIE